MPLPYHDYLKRCQEQYRLFSTLLSAGMIVKMRKTTLTIAWDAWKKNIQDSTIQRASFKSAASHWRNVILAKAWACWVDRAQARAHFFGTIARIGILFIAPHIGSAFLQWLRYTEERKIVKANLSTFKDLYKAFCVCVQSSALFLIVLIYNAIWTYEQIEVATSILVRNFKRYH